VRQKMGIIQGNSLPGVDVHRHTEAEEHYKGRGGYLHLKTLILARHQCGGFRSQDKYPIKKWRQTAIEKEQNDISGGNKDAYSSGS